MKEIKYIVRVESFPTDSSPVTSIFENIYSSIKEARAGKKRIEKQGFSEKIEIFKETITREEI